MIAQCPQCHKNQFSIHKSGDYVMFICSLCMSITYCHVTEDDAFSRMWSGPKRTEREELDAFLRR